MNVLSDKITKADKENANFINRVYEIRGFIDFENDLFTNRVMPILEHLNVPYKMVYNGKKYRFKNLTDEQLTNVITAYVVMRRDMAVLDKALQGVR